MGPAGWSVRRILRSFWNRSKGTHDVNICNIEGLLCNTFFGINFIIKPQTKTNLKYIFLMNYKKFRTETYIDFFIAWFAFFLRVVFEER